MKALLWGSFASVALTISVPGVAEAATSTASTPLGGVSTSLQHVTSTLTTPLAGATKLRAASGGAAAPTTVVTPAPAGEADAYAAKVGGVLALSHTHASASPGGESSTANAVEVMGAAPAPLGGTQTGSGSNSGSLYDTGTTPAGRLAIAPWAVENSSNSSGNSAAGLADILLVDLGSPGSAQSASLRVLQSTSSASWTPTSSSGQGTSDGAILDVGGPGGLTIDVLHSQTSATGAGSSYLVSINGTEIGTSGQTNGSCQLTLPSLLSLSCLTASGGPGVLGPGGTTVQSSAAGVLSTTVGGTSGLTAGVLQVASSSGRVAATSSKPTVAAPTPSAGKAAVIPAAAPPAASLVASSHPLAFTGAEIVDTLAVGGISLAFGLVLVGASKRRRRLA